MKFSYFRALSVEFDTFIRKVQEIKRDLLPKKFFICLESIVNLYYKLFYFLKKNKFSKRSIRFCFFFYNMRLADTRSILPLPAQ